MQDHVRTWLRQCTSHWQDWPPERLLAAKREAGTRISVVIPARNEERTVGRVVAALRQALLTATPLVDEILVVDSDSTDGTARVAERAGAVVHRARDIAPALGSYPGKGEALWKSLLVTQGDLLVFVDADLTRWGPHFVTGLLGPLLTDRRGAGQHEASGFAHRLFGHHTGGGDATDHAPSIVREPQVAVCAQNERPRPTFLIRHGRQREEFAMAGDIDADDRRSDAIGSVEPDLAV